MGSPGGMQHFFWGDGEDAKASPPLCPCSCGNCKRSQPCSPVDGFCLACQPGWNGTLCKERCAPGFHGEGCLQPCPRCRHGDACDAETGSCLHCEPGWMGPRYPPPLPPRVQVLVGVPAP